MEGSSFVAGFLLDGHYELTLVAEDSDTNTQWSSDPEFETGN